MIGSGPVSLRASANSSISLMTKSAKKRTGNEKLQRSLFTKYGWKNYC